MTTTRNYSPGRRRNGFRLPKPDQRKKPANSIGATLLATMSSKERVLENTPSLKKLYEFLAKPLP